MRRRAVGIAAFVGGLLVLWWWWPAPRVDGPSPERGPGVAEAAAEPVVEADDADPLEAPGDVECEISVPQRGSPQTLVEVDPATMEPIGEVTTHLEDGWLVFVPRHPDGLGVVTLFGYRPTAIGWSGGACLGTIAPEPIRPVRIEGEVRGWRGVTQPVVNVEAGGPSAAGTDRMFQVKDDGTFRCELYSDHWLDVHVTVDFGTRMLLTEPTRVEPDEDEVVHLVLDAPSIPAAGWDLMPTIDGGFRVMAVAPGTPAALAGVAVSDRVVRLDGRPAEAFELEDAIEVSLPVVVERERDGVRSEVVLVPGELP